MQRQDYNNHKQQYAPYFCTPITRMTVESEAHYHISKAEMVPVESRLRALHISDAINEGVPAATQALEMWLEMR